MILSRKKPTRLEVVRSRDADPSPEFYQYAEPGRMLIRRKNKVAGSADLKAVDHVAGNTGDCSRNHLSRWSPWNFLTSVIASLRRLFTTCGTVEGQAPPAEILAANGCYGPDDPEATADDGEYV